MSNARILGIDPGLNTTGYAVIEAAASGPRLLEAGMIRSVERREPADLPYKGIDVGNRCERPICLEERRERHRVCRSGPGG